MADGSTGDSSVSKSFLWMMIALFGGMGIMLAGGMFMATRVVHSLELSSATDKNTVRTPIGDFRFQKANQTGPILPVYPHAALVLPTSNSLPTPLKNNQPQVLTATYHSTDPRDFILTWYTERLGPEFARHEAGDTPVPDVFRQARIANSAITFLAERGEQVRIVALAEDPSGTTITLARVDQHQTR